MTDQQERIGMLSRQLSDKKVKRLQLKVLANLNKKLLSIDNPGVTDMFNETVQLLEEYVDGDEAKERVFKRAFATLRKKVKELYGFVPKGQIQSEYLAMGTGIGVALGTVFIPMNVAFIGIGLPIGVAVGLALGQQKEKEAEQEGKIY